MVSVRPLIGKVSFARALRFTAKTGHVSHFSKHGASGLFSFPVRLREELEHEIRVSRDKNQSASLLASRERMLELAKALEKYSGPQLSFSQVIAALALSKGLSKQSLAQYTNSLNSLNRRSHKMKQPLFSAKESWLVSVINSDALQKVDRFLRETPGKHEVRTMAKQLGLSSQNVNLSLVVLESLRTAVQLPFEEQPVSSRKRNPSLPWITASLRNTAFSFPGNVTGYKVLQALAQGPKILADLSREGAFNQPARGSLPKRATLLVLRRMEAEGLVSVRTVQRPKVHRRVQEYFLTDLGKDLLQAQESRQGIHPQMRRVLAGQPIQGLLPAEQRQLADIARFVSVRRIFEEQLAQKKPLPAIYAFLSEKFSLTPKQLQNRLRFYGAPWAGMKIDSLRKRFLPVLYERFPFDAEWLDKHLSSIEKQVGKKVIRSRRILFSPSELFNQYVPFARWRAGLFWEQHARRLSHVMEREDLDQEALISLQRAAERFEPARNFAFGTFAGTVIDRDLKRVLNQSLAEKRGGGKKPLSLDLVGDSEKGRVESFSARIPASEAPAIIPPQVRLQLISAVNALAVSDQNKADFFARTGLLDGEQKTLIAVAKQRGVSTERIRQVEKKILKRLREKQDIRRLEDLLK